jgi:ribosome-associated protein
MDLQGIASFTDYFVICTGTSDRMLDALAEGALEAVRKTHHLTGRTEGYPAAGWLIVDFSSVIIHIFAPEQRQYYKLEDLWNKGKVLLRLQ